MVFPLARSASSAPKISRSSGFNKLKNLDLQPINNNAVNKKSDKANPFISASTLSPYISFSLYNSSFKDFFLLLVAKLYNFRNPFIKKDPPQQNSPADFTGSIPA